jgi:hypothetical protein
MAVVQKKIKPRITCNRNFHAVFVLCPNKISNGFFRYPTFRIGGFKMGSGLHYCIFDLEAKQMLDKSLDKPKLALFIDAECHKLRQLLAWVQGFSCHWHLD